MGDNEDSSENSIEEQDVVSSSESIIIQEGYSSLLLRARFLGGEAAIILDLLQAQTVCSNTQLHLPLVDNVQLTPPEILLK